MGSVASVRAPAGNLTTSSPAGTLAVQSEALAEGNGASPRPAAFLVMAGYTGQLCSPVLSGVAMRKRAPVRPQPSPARGIVHIRAERCKGCELCIDYCPTRVLALSSEFNAKGYHFPVVVNDDCINCQSCRTICPEFAVFATPDSRLRETPATVPA